MNLISCLKDENVPNSPLNEKPIITLVKPDTNFINCNTSYHLSIDLFAQSSLISGKSLAGFKITSKFENDDIVIVMDTAISDNEFFLNDYVIISNAANGTEIWTFRITDVTGEYEEVNLILNITFYPPPSLFFLSGEYQPGWNRINGDTTLPVGEEFVFGIAANTNSDKDLKRLLILRNFENVSTITILDSAFSSANIIFDIMTFANPSAGSEDFVCTVWDKNDTYVTISFSISTQPVAPDITTYNDKILGAQASIIGCSFASNDGVVYTLEQAKMYSNKVDFLYFYGTTNLATLAAPDDADAAMVFTGVNGLDTWIVKNPTRFKSTTLSSSDFDAIQTSSQLVTAAILPNEPNLSKANDLSAGDVLAFKTVNDFYGLIRVDAIIGANDAGVIQITLKLQ
jgi:hypothetical protein